MLQGPPNFNVSDPLVLDEPAEENAALGQLSLGGGLLGIDNTRQSQIKVPISNHSKHDIILPKSTSLGTIQYVAKVLETGAPEPQQADLKVAKATLATGHCSCVSITGYPTAKPCQIDTPSLGSRILPTHWEDTVGSQSWIRAKHAIKGLLLKDLDT